MSDAGVLRAQDQEKRAREIADNTRRFLMWISAGAIVILVGLVGAFNVNCVLPVWAIYPIIIFAGSIIVTGFSLCLAKHKAKKRRDAFLSGEVQPNYEKFLWQNRTYEGISLLAFIVGVSLSLYKINTEVMPVILVTTCT